MNTSFEDIKTALDDHLRDQLQPVTYKWISRQFKINYDVSKRVLFRYSNIVGNVSLIAGILCSCLNVLWLFLFLLFKSELERI